MTRVCKIVFGDVEFSVFADVGGAYAIRKIDDLFGDVGGKTFFRKEDTIDQLIVELKRQVEDEVQAPAKDTERG